MSQESRGNDEARKVKLLGAGLMIAGIILAFIVPGIGILSLVVGFVAFVIGRFMD
jgi:hypothetical protein